MHMDDAVVHSPNITLLAVSKVHTLAPYWPGANAACTKYSHVWWGTDVTTQIYKHLNPTE